MTYSESKSMYILMYSGSRLIAAVARMDYFPMYSRQLRTWHDYFDTPIYALMAQCIWCMIIILFIGSSFMISSYKLLANFSMYSYWFFYLATGIGLLVIRNRRDNAEPTGLYRVQLPIAGVFILSGIYIMIFSFIVDVKCPDGLQHDECNEYSRTRRIHKISPFIISYGFLFVSLIF